MMPVYLVYSLGRDDDAVPENCMPDIVIRPSDILAVLPNRQAYSIDCGDWTASSERFSLAAMLGPLRHFEYIWFVEYDVDYAGDWGDFFRRVKTMPGDYLATHVRWRSDDPNWPHWGGFEPPDTVGPEKQLASFHPISRFSRALREAYVEAVERRGWRGYSEAMFPTVALHRGLSVVDLGGDGPFVPEGWTGKNYRPSRSPKVLSTSFGYRPPFSFQYFHEAPGLFHELGLLHHPIKETNPSGAPDLYMDLPAAAIEDEVTWEPADMAAPASPPESGSGLPSVPMRQADPILAPLTSTKPPNLSIPQTIRREIRRLGRQFGATRD